jgi:hypothetical protein
MMPTARRMMLAFPGGDAPRATMAGGIAPCVHSATSVVEPGQELLAEQAAGDAYSFS